MNKFVWIGLGAGALVAGGIALWMFTSQPAPQPVPVNPYDYTLTESWDARPAAQLLIEQNSGRTGQVLVLPKGPKLCSVESRDSIAHFAIAAQMFHEILHCHSHSQYRETVCEVPQLLEKLDFER